MNLQSISGDSLGSIEIIFDSLIVQDINLTQKLNMFSTQDISYREVQLKFINVTIQRNTLELGAMFSFLHNFRLVQIMSSLF